MLGFTLGIGRLGAVLAPMIGSYLLVHVPAGEGLASPAGAVFVAFAVASLGGVAAACWLGCLVRRRSRLAAEAVTSCGTEVGARP